MRDDKKQKTKRAYRRPAIRSAGTYERLALACTGSMGGLGMFNCTVKGSTVGLCSDGCAGS